MKKMIDMKKMKTLAIVCLAALVATAGSVDAAAAKGGTTAGSVLRLGNGARNPAMGNTGSAGAEGVSALHYNPAGLGYTSRATVGMTYQNLVLDIQQGDLGFTHPINSVSSWGVGFTYLDYGKTQRVTVQDFVNGIASGATFSGRDIVLGASYGRAMTESIALGITAKFINLGIDNSTASAFAADLAAQFRPRDLPVPIRAGLYVKNLGTAVKFEQVSEDLPLLFGGGLEVDLFNDHLTLSGDVEKVRDLDVSGGIGAEFRFMDDMFALRAGYDARIDADDGLTAGFGVKLSDLTMDYAYIPFGKFGNNHRVSMNYNFGPDYDYRR